MKKKPVIGKCRLCLRDGQLVDSHVIPKFHYKPLKQAEVSFSILSTNAAKKEKKEQKGVTENLLCAACEKRLQVYEDHLARVIYGEPGVSAHQINPQILVLEGFDYHKVKNALLSILWRMSICGHPFFSEVALGEKHEETLRTALLNDATFSEEEYPITLTAPLIDGQFYPDVILSPDCDRVGKNRIYRSLISGLLFAFFVGGAPLEEKFKPFILRKKSWPMLKVAVQKIPFLFAAYQRLAEANAQRAKL